MRHPTRMTTHLPFRLSPRDYALFLDIDGTLLDFSISPGEVVVPSDIPATLRTLQLQLGGAFAFISGRRATDIEALFGTNIAFAAEHGALLRTADGTVIFETTPDAALADITRELRQTIASYPGVLLEEKHYGVTVHWRAAPAAAQAMTALVRKVIAPYPRLTLLPAHEALEVRMSGANKAAALEIFMETPPFSGRLPIFIGDDVTDEPAIALAASRGGWGLHVGRDFGGRPQAVRDWLTESAANVATA